MSIKFVAYCDHYQEDREFEIFFHEEPYCEHCAALEPYSLMIDYSDGGCPYCLGCRNGIIDIPKEILDQAEKESRKFKIEYYKKKLEELESQQ